MALFYQYWRHAQADCANTQAPHQLNIQHARRRCTKKVTQQKSNIIMSICNKKTCYFSYLLPVAFFLTSVMAFRFLKTPLTASTRAVSTAADAVKHMRPVEFAEILKSPQRNTYQVVDVREPNELVTARINDDSILNVPLSGSATWTTESLQTLGLDKSVKTIFLCRGGVRSLKAATIAGK